MLFQHGGGSYLFDTRFVGYSDEIHRFAFSIALCTPWQANIWNGFSVAYS